MTKPNPRAETAALRLVALEDVMSLSDDELLREVIEDGEDVVATANEVKAAMRDAAAAALRQRLMEAKARAGRQPMSRTTTGRARPALEQLKRRVQDAFAVDPALRLAFRDGKRQSDADWESLYDDLVALGKIQDSPSED